MCKTETKKRKKDKKMDYRELARDLLDVCLDMYDLEYEVQLAFPDDIDAQLALHEAISELEKENAE